MIKKIKDKIDLLMESWNRDVKNLNLTNLNLNSYKWWFKKWMKSNSSVDQRWIDLKKDFPGFLTGIFGTKNPSGIHEILTLILGKRARDRCGGDVWGGRPPPIEGGKFDPDGNLRGSSIRSSFIKVILIQDRPN